MTSTERQQLRDLAARLHITTRLVAIVGRFPPTGVMREHPMVELERIEAELRALAREP